MKRYEARQALAAQNDCVPSPAITTVDKQRSTGTI